MVNAAVYPFQGIGFLITTPSLWKKCLCGLLITVSVALCSLLGFYFLIEPTTKFLVRRHFQEETAFHLSVAFMFTESATFFIIFSLLFLPILKEKIFKHTLKLKGYKESIVNCPAPNMTWKVLKGTILYAIVQILTILLTIPLNLIPILGQILYCLINGFVYAWGIRLMDLMPYHGLSFSKSKSYVFSHYQNFLSFGTIAFALELVPLLNWLFICTNAVGAALWAIEDYHRHFRIFLNHLHRIYFRSFLPY